MEIISARSRLFGHITVPGSKSHTIRALLLASLAEGTSTIHNPLLSADCISTSKAIPLMGASVELSCGAWTVHGAGKNIHLPFDVVDVGNSGSLLYFMSPLCATFEGATVFTGDESIRRRPVNHVVDVLNQLGSNSFVTQPGSKCCPMVVTGPVKKHKVLTDGTASSQYISGLMMAALRMDCPLEIELTDPKETPYLTMTQKWLEDVGVKCEVSDDFKHIKVFGPCDIKAFETTVPSDWEAVAFPLVAALLSDSEVVIDNIDGSGTQGDEEIVNVLRSLGADIEWNRETKQITVRGGKKSRNGLGRLTTTEFIQKELRVNLSGYPDALCALAVAACFTEGKVVFEDIGVCRRKETDRIMVMKKELEKLGAKIEECDESMTVFGHSSYLADGSENPEFCLHGGDVESYLDHRVAMSLACFGLGLKNGEKVKIKDAECCSVSFPDFFEKMKGIGAGFKSVES